MSNFIIRTYREIIPPKVRKKFYIFFLKRVFSIIFFIKSKCYLFCSHFFKFSGEKKLCYAYMGKYGKTPFPYSFSLKFKDKDVDVYTDNINSMKYVIHNHKKLFFPSFYTTELIKESYRSLLLEQDDESAHKYVESYNRFEGKILLDIGASEGMIALDAVEKAKYVYLFECMPEWHEALTATFEPYKHKTTIVQKYVSNKDDEECLTLDTFFKDNPSLSDELFIKMDIEGAELQALHGAKSLFESKKIDFAICLYHKDDDIVDIPAFLKQFGYECEFSTGYIFCDYWFRKGIARKRI